jgi:hypothetical protein
LSNGFDDLPDCHGNNAVASRSASAALGFSVNHKQLRGALAAQDTGEHGDAFLGEGVREILDVPAALQASKLES